MLKIDRINSKILINGIETQDPTEIGVAVLNLISSKKPNPKAAHKKLKTYLSNNHMSLTQERRVILNIMLQCEQPFTASQIHAKVQHGLSIALRTVHNALSLFQEADIIKRTSIGVDELGKCYEFI